MWSALFPGSRLILLVTKRSSLHGFTKVTRGPGCISSHRPSRPTPHPSLSILLSDCSRRLTHVNYFRKLPCLPPPSQEMWEQEGHEVWLYASLLLSAGHCGWLHPLGRPQPLAGGLLHAQVFLRSGHLLPVLSFSGLGAIIAPGSLLLRVTF